MKGHQYPEPFDQQYDRDEQLPRRLEVDIYEKIVDGRAYVYQRIGIAPFGDRLTDNSREDDDYRFHDVFHLAYLAILGWSPVTRSLLRLKRKSNPRIDEVEDGRRAIDSEEAVSAFIFQHAKGDMYFERTTKLDENFLTIVCMHIEGFEVCRRPLWLWEEAILEGYKVFRFLRQHRRARVTADLKNWRIDWEPLRIDWEP